MEKSEIYNQIWMGLQEPTDLDPDEDTQYSDVNDTTGPLLLWVVNQAQRKVASWKDPVTGRRTKIRSLMNSLYYGSTYFEDSLTFSSGDNDTYPPTITVTSDDLSSSHDDRYNGWILEDAHGERAIVVDYVASTKTLSYHTAFGTAPTTDDTLSLYKNFDYLLPSDHNWVSDHISLPDTDDYSLAGGNLLEVLNVVDMESRNILKPATRDSLDVDVNLATGDPQTWRRFGNKIIYDVGVDSGRQFKMEYYRMPRNLTHTDADVELEIPEVYHWAVVLWGIWWGHKRAGESARAYSAKKDFQDEMREIVGQYHIANERVEAKAEVVYKERSY